MGIFYNVKVVYKHNDGKVLQAVSDDLLSKTRWWRTVGVTSHKSGKIDDPDDLVGLVNEIKSASFYTIVSMDNSLE
jgi:hypothetical protein